MSQVRKCREIAILVSDIEAVKKISDIFRDLGIIPHFYQNLSGFWKGISEYMPDLAIVDVMLMSEGELALKDHPFVKSEKLSLAFYHSIESRPLIMSTFDIFNYGIIYDDIMLEGQIATILKRFDKIKEAEQLKLKQFKIEKKYDMKLSKIMMQLQDQKKRHYYQANVFNVCKTLNSYRGHGNFYKLCDHFFSQWGVIDSYSILELSDDCRALVSPKVNGKKYLNQSPINLGQKVDHGIDFFSQNMAEQLFTDQWGDKFVSVFIKGRNKNPDKIIYLHIKSIEFLLKFDWEILAISLSGLYLSTIVNLKSNVKRGNLKRSRQYESQLF